MIFPVPSTCEWGSPAERSLRNCPKIRLLSISCRHSAPGLMCWFMRGSVFPRGGVFALSQEVELNSVRNSQIVDLSRKCSWIDPDRQAP